MSPLTLATHKTQQHVDQQRAPYLPAHRVGRVSQKVSELQGLLNLFEKHFDLPACFVEFADRGGALAGMARAAVRENQRIDSQKAELLRMAVAWNFYWDSLAGFESKIPRRTEITGIP